MSVTVTDYGKGQMLGGLRDYIDEYNAADWAREFTERVLQEIERDQPMQEIELPEIQEGYEVIEVVYNRTLQSEDMGKWLLEEQKFHKVPRSATKRIAQVIKSADTFWQQNQVYSTDPDPDSQRRVELESFLMGLAKASPHEFVSAALVQSLDEPVERIHVFYPRQYVDEAARIAGAADSILSALDELFADD